MCVLGKGTNNVVLVHKHNATHVLHPWICVLGKSRRSTPNIVGAPT